MSLDITAHFCTNLRISAALPENSNMIDLEITTKYSSRKEEKSVITLYGLPTHLTDALQEALRPSVESEDEFRYQGEEKRS